MNSKAKGYEHSVFQIKRQTSRSLQVGTHMHLASMGQSKNSPRRIGRKKNLATQPSRVDLWISRIASISQTAAVLLTAAGFYFTVLPLYQKSLLEEAIAKKELELNRITTTLNKTYERMRHSATKEYIFYASLKCSGLLLPPPTLYLIEKSNKNKTPHTQQILEIEAQDCLIQSLEKIQSINELNPTDLNSFRNEITKIGTNLDKVRHSLATQISGEWNSKSSTKKADEYSNLVRTEVNSLRSIQWRKEEQ